MAHDMDLEKLVDDLFERNDAKAHAIMHEIARVACSKVLLIDHNTVIIQIEGDS